MSSLLLRKTNLDLKRISKATSQWGVAFFILFLNINLLAAPHKGETYKNIIEKSQNLNLQQDRTQATQILIQAIKKESKKNSAFNELVQALDNAASIFYTDKGQQLYELSLTTNTTDVATTLAKLQEAQRLEGDNIKILLATARAQVFQNECSNALASVLKAKEIHPYSGELDLLQGQIYVCLDQKEKYFAIKSNVDAKTLAQSIYWLNLDAEVLLLLGQAEASKERLLAAIKLNEKYPQTYFVFWKLILKQGGTAIQQAKKFNDLCKNLSPKQKREYSVEPRLCRDIAETEAFLKKNGVTE